MRIPTAAAAKVPLLNPIVSSVFIPEPPFLTAGEVGNTSLAIRRLDGSPNRFTINGRWRGNVTSLPTQFAIIISGMFSPAINPVRVYYHCRFCDDIFEFAGAHFMIRFNPLKLTAIGYCIWPYDDDRLVARVDR
ncbi:MAG: hypothetical protein P4L74_05060 [Candidatus Doudnabacteria bacterium]|nr:hypothetical protein [Candidatus Doudnabacteria bacterium]